MGQGRRYRPTCGSACCSPASGQAPAAPGALAMTRGLWRVPLLWSLRLAYAWLAVACLGMALWHFGAPFNPSLAVHALTIGAMAGLILAADRSSASATPAAPCIAGRTALLRSYQPWPASSRVALVLLWPLALWLAGLCWSVRLGLYLWRYGPMLWQARVDGHPG